MHQCFLILFDIVVSAQVHLGLAITWHRQNRVDIQHVKQDCKGVDVPYQGLRFQTLFNLHLPCFTNDTYTPTEVMCLGIRVLLKSLLCKFSYVAEKLGSKSKAQWKQKLALLATY
ncbi:hypothetical protein AQUCO_00100138v1 [Aquilegia coerulea]|uniref:Secreted protein n=1 Tax=Aquilegia coerulea TaxID=218851 RepID=A0A2G5F8W7_AQUCA|nr:hypothetical protein AQUCO_00100138v1 [Aquilegia coerulea]